MKTQAKHTVVAGMIYLCGCIFAHAATEYFNDANREASSVVQIGPVTVSGFDPVGPGLVGTTTGIGLGVAGLGSIDSVDLQLHYSVGQAFPDNGFGLSENLLLNSSEDFTSITITPHFPTILETGLPVDSAFSWFGVTVTWPGFSRAVMRFDPSNAAPATLALTPSSNFPSPIDSLHVSPDFEGGAAYPQEIQTLYDYRLQHLNEEQTIRLGFTVVSVDVVPEPSASALLGIGGLVFLLRRSQRFGVC